MFHRVPLPHAERIFSWQQMFESAYRDRQVPFSRLARHHHQARAFKVRDKLTFGDNLEKPRDNVLETRNDHVRPFHKSGLRTYWQWCGLAEAEFAPSLSWSGDH